MQNTLYKEGVTDGIEQGEKNRNIEIAKSMKENGENPETISKYTGLTFEEIEKLN